jgi:hypothetical protein
MGIHCISATVLVLGVVNAAQAANPAVLIQGATLVSGNDEALVYRRERLDDPWLRRSVPAPRIAGR